MDTKFRKAITVEKRLAVVLRRFSTGNDYRTISKAFGLQNQQLSFEKSLLNCFAFHLN